MAQFAVQVDAAPVNRGISQAPSLRSKLTADPRLLFWRRLLDQALADAKRTLFGLPTDSAILARWWIAEFQPKPSDKDSWESSLACACDWLNLDATTERARMVAVIDQALTEASLNHSRSVTYRRRAAVLTCAGERTSIGRQFVLPLVSIADYEHVAGIEHGDQYALYDQVIAA